MSSRDPWSCGKGGDEVSVERFIADQRTFYRVPYAVCCVNLGISTSWFYKWLNRPATGRQQRRAEVDAEVRARFVASRRTYGSPRIHADLSNGAPTAHDRVDASAQEETAPAAMR